MKHTAKRLLSLLLALIFCVSLFPAAALAEEPGEIAPAEEPAPAFLLQPESGGHAPGETYLLTWELNLIPDRLELVREALHLEDDADPSQAGELGRVELLFLRDLEPESTSLEMTAPEEEMVFRLRAIFGEDELISDPFTVSVILSEGADLEGDPSSPAALQDDSGDSAEAPAAVSGEPAADDPDALPVTDLPEGTIASGIYGPHADYTIDNQGVMTVSGYGGMYKKYGYAEPFPWESYRSVITALVIKGNVEDVGENAFRKCTALKTVTLGDGVKEVCDFAFQGCTSLETITIGKSLEKFSTWALLTTPSLRAFEVSEKNILMSSEDGVLFTDGGKTLLSYPRGKSGSSYRVPEGVTKIASDGFLGCAQLFAITLPSTLTVIGQQAFDDCSSLVHIEIPYGVAELLPWCFNNCSALETVSLPRSLLKIDCSAFEDCTSLVTLPLPDSLTTIDSGAFSGCTSLASMTIPDSVTEIEGYLFSGCTSLVQVHLPDDLTEIPSGLFNGCCSLENVTIPAGVKGIRRQAFRNCASITSITIPDGVEYMHEYAFEGCTALTEIRIPEGVKNLGEGLFKDCTALQSVTLPRYLERVFDYCFENCGALKSLVLPDSVNYIGASAFSGCGGLKIITIPAAVTTICEKAFLDCDSLSAVCFRGSQSQWSSVWIGDFNEDLKEASRFYNVLDSGLCGADLCWVMTESGLSILGSGPMWNYGTSDNLPPWYARRASISGVTLEDTVTAIGANAFSGFSALQELTLPAALTAIGAGAFSNCTGLTALSLPSGLRSIGSSAFHNCKLLAELSLPDGLKTIGDYAFQKCAALKSISIPNSVTGLGEYAFSMSGLQSVNLGSGVPSIPAGVFAYTDLTSVVFPSNITAIGANAFAYTKLKSETLPKNLETLGEGAFAGCTKLSSITLPDSLLSIGDSAFSGCILLYSVVIPANVASIGSYAFADCSALAKINFQGGAPSIGTNAFRSVTATAYYIAGMPNWEDGVQKNYGGTITWCSLQKCGDHLTWTLEDGVLVINGEGDMWDFSTDYAPGWYSQKGDITSVDIRYKVTSIGAYAFYNCSSLESVYVGPGVTSVGIYAFRGCSSLDHVMFNGPAPSFGQRAFYGVTTTAYYIPDSTWTDSVMQNYGGTVDWTAIGGQCGEDAFWYLDSDNVLHITGSGPMEEFSGTFSVPWYYCREEITAVEIAEGITSIGQNAFYGCSALQRAVIPAGVTGIGDEAFYKCVMLEELSLPSGLESIGLRAFYNCKLLPDQDFPTGLKTIGNNAFTGCESFTAVTLPNSVSSLGTGVFSWCTNLESAVLGTGVKVLPYDSFNRCKNLVSVTLPSGMTSIGQNAFYNCYALEHITLPASLSILNQSAFSYSGLKEIILPASVTSIGLMAFNGCSSLTDAYYIGTEAEWNEKVTLGNYNTNLTDVLHFVRGVGFCGEDGDNLKWMLDHDGVLTIWGEGAMYNYTSNTGSSTAWFGMKSEVRSVVIQSGVTTIGSCAFRNCTGMTDAAIPDTVSIIGGYAFYGCNHLTDAALPAGLTKLGYSSFYGSGLLSLTIPSGVTEIPEYCFQRCTQLESVTIPDSVTRFRNYGFSGCTALTEIRVPAGVTLMGSYVFSGCTALEKVTLSAGLTTLGYSMFARCTALESIIIPAGVREVPYCCFYGCTALKQISFMGSAPSFGDTPFYNVTATASYPEGDVTWTEDVMQDYGGTITWVSGLPINDVNFPDPRFRDAVKRSFDRDGSGLLTRSEINDIVDIVIDDELLWSLQGVEYFTELTSLECCGGKLTELDLRNNTKLNYLDLVGQSQLESLELSGLAALECLYVRGTALTELDISSCPILLDAWLNGTHTEHDWGLEVNGGDSLGGYMELDKDLTVITGIVASPEITAQPADVSCKAGETASFLVEASGDDLSYQWYYRKPGSESWTPVSAAAGKHAIYSFTTAARHNGYLYKCVVTNSAGSAESSVALLTVYAKPVILTQPVDQTVTVGQTAGFSVEAEGLDLSYKWYYRTSAEASWKATSAASGKTANYSLTAEERHNGYQYRCRVTNPAGSVYTQVVTLTVNPAAKPVIVTQPQSVTGEIGKTVHFTVAAEGAGLSYQWYYRLPGTTAWKAVNAASGKTADYSLKPAERHNGYQYRCKVKNDAGYVYTKAVTLTVAGAAPVIQTQPKDASVTAGAKASFTVKAVGTELSYQWQYRTGETGTWKNVSAASGKTAKYTLTAAERHNGYQYQCVVTNPQGSATSTFATLTVTPAA